jgi:hypothetical protein
MANWQFILKSTTYGCVTLIIIAKKITTFKHDSRNVGEMAIVSTTVGHPSIDVWKYPLPDDKHIFKIYRV